MKTSIVNRYFVPPTALNNFCNTSSQYDRKFPVNRVTTLNFRIRELCTNTSTIQIKIEELKNYGNV
jgi:hypothetical protein